MLFVTSGVVLLGTGTAATYSNGIPMAANGAVSVGVIP